MPHHLSPQQRLASLPPHQVRDEILDLLRTYGLPLSPVRMSEILERSIGSVAYHVRILASAGIISITHLEQKRGASEHFYKIDDDMESTQLFDPMVALLLICDTLTLPDRYGGLPHTAKLDGRARTELQAVLDRIKQPVRDIASAADDRLHFRRPPREIDESSAAARDGNHRESA